MKNLLRLRMEAGMSQQEVAEKAGLNLTQPQIHRYEVGKTTTSIEVVMQIAKVLNTTVENLMGDEENTQWTETINENDGKRSKKENNEEIAFEQNALNLLRKLKYEDRETVLLYLEKLTKEKPPLDYY